jgi:hypothetical protein
MTIADAGVSGPGVSSPSSADLIPSQDEFEEPTLSGGTDVGDTITCDEGNWNDADRFVYQWYLNGILLPWANTDTIDAQAGWVGSSLFCLVIAVNAYGSATARSNIATITAAGAYQGPLDLVPGAVVGYSSARALSADMLGENGYMLRRDSDDAELAFAYDSETGLIDASAITAWAGGASFFKSWNDHAGSNAVVQATAAGQPAWDASSVGSKPGVIFDSTSEQFLATAGNVNFANGAFTIFIVCNIYSGQDNHPLIAENAQESQAAGILFLYTTAPGEEGGGIICSGDDENYNNGNGFSGTFPQAKADSPIILEAVWNASTNILFINGESVAVSGLGYGSENPGSINARLAVGTSDAGTPTYFFEGEIVEIIPYPSVLTTEQRTTLRENIAAFYGITLPE